MAAVAAIFSTINTGKIQQVETKVKDLELQAARQEASNEFANLFLDKALKGENLWDTKSTSRRFFPFTTLSRTRMIVRGTRPAS